MKQKTKGWESCRPLTRKTGKLINLEEMTAAPAFVIDAQAVRDAEVAVIVHVDFVFFADVVAAVVTQGDFYTVSPILVPAKTKLTTTFLILALAEGYGERANSLHKTPCYKNRADNHISRSCIG